MIQKLSDLVSAIGIAANNSDPKEAQSSVEKLLTSYLTQLGDLCKDTTDTTCNYCFPYDQLEIIFDGVLADHNGLQINEALETYEQWNGE